MTKPERLGVITVGVVQHLSPRITFSAVNIKNVHSVYTNTHRLYQHLYKKLFSNWRNQAWVCFNIKFEQSKINCFTSWEQLIKRLKQYRRRLPCLFTLFLNIFCFIWLKINTYWTCLHLCFYVYHSNLCKSLFYMSIIHLHYSLFIFSSLDTPLYTILNFILCMLYSIPIL